MLVSAVASPKCASPGRLRHNPYACSSSAATPTTPPIPPSMSTSFSSVAPLTPPTAYAPAATWNASQDFQYNVHAVPFVTVAALDPSGTPFSFGTEEAVFASPVEMNPFCGGVQPAYESMDPTLAFMMYNAASAAAHAAAQQHMMSQSAGFVSLSCSSASRSGNGNRRADVENPHVVPSFDDLQALAGSLTEHARSAAGSSFIQSALKESNDPRCAQFVWTELAPYLGELLIDPHGCYVIKTLIEQLSPTDAACVLETITMDENLGFSICTHSLHTRRVVQHIIECIDGNFLCDIMSRRCADIAMTQQGCIVMQRAMDHAPPGPHRSALLETISSHLATFAMDPYANYVVQHLMEIGDRVETSEAMLKAFRGRITELACNKFASNVIEKCLFHCTAEVQHEILNEMYSIGHQGLYDMLQDSFGNYIIQSSIALATFRDVSFIDERLRPVLTHTPYGYKIEARLDRRLKGKPVTTRAPAQAQSGASSGTRRRNGRTGSDTKIPEGEVPW